MTSKILFISLACLLGFWQKTPLQSIRVLNIYREQEEVLLSKPDTTVLLLFLNANKCQKCVELIGHELNSILAESERPLEVIVLIRMGWIPEYQRELIDMLGIPKNGKVKYRFDIENERIGIETAKDIKGNFKAFSINRTPALIIFTQNDLVRLDYNSLFNKDGDLTVSIAQRIKKK